MSSVADFHLALTDVNDNPPRLAKEYTGLFFCHPLSATESLIFEVTDDDLQSLWRSQFTFALGKESLKNDWQVSKINGELSDVQGENSTVIEGITFLPPIGWLYNSAWKFLLVPRKPFTLWEHTGKVFKALGFVGREAWHRIHPGWGTWINEQFEHQL